MRQMNMNASLQNTVNEALGTTVKTASPIHVGFGLTGCKALLQDGRIVAIKADQTGKSSNTLSIQGRMLDDLRLDGSLPVPQVYHSANGLLIMDWVDNDGTQLDKDGELEAAHMLAHLHDKPRDQFGYPYDTLIGPLPQPNEFAPNWLDFFRDSRLMPMAEAALTEGKMDTRMLKRIETLANRLDRYLTPPRHPALIHGDLWAGNVLTNQRRISAVIDPACYFAHPEIELAFTHMFSLFSDHFLDAYQELSPLEPGFKEIRREIYNLYPTLVHLRLFGASYLPPIDQLLRKLGI